jgi:acetyl-CoA carboxylase biotin carboxyl carrier protein
MSLSNEDVAEILALLDASRFTELHVKTDSFTLSLSRGGDGGWVQEMAITRAAAIDNPPAAGENKPAVASVANADGLVAVPSPLLGTFYRAPKPGAPPYVDIGSEVEAETVVGLVETMKLMNSVYAGVRGRVREICIADAQFVEQDTVLVLVEPAP